MSDSTRNGLTDGIAIIGMAGRFPGAKNIDEFWQNLCGGVESISFFSDQELLAAGVSRALLDNPKYVKAAGVLEGVELFDASFFNYSPREAETIDPQHRFFLECAWEALEHAGYNSQTFDGLIGVYGGVGANTYLFNLYSNDEFITTVDPNQLSIGNEKEYLTTRVSYKLNLKGQSVAVQSACSTSLVAVHLACQSLLNYQCDAALAGGVLVCAKKAGYVYQDGGFLSPDGHNRSFDEKAKGSVGGNGVCLVVLKRLEEALTDRDCIHAVIRGSAVNNDGSLKVSYTAPSVDGQAEVIASAQAVAGVEAETISYMEAHGTATPLGDPIEIAAYTKAFRASTQAKGFCGVGSVKSNIGHLGEAAGVTGLVKTALSLKHKLLPPSLHFERPNPEIDFENSPFYVNASLSEWKTGTTPRRAGVSSFGIGGTNVHVILEEAPDPEPSGDSRPEQLLCLSARTATALETATANLADFLRRQESITLADAAYTLHVGRQAFAHRRVIVCRSREDAVAALEAIDPQRVLTSAPTSERRPLAFMFSGLGDHYVGMAEGLYRHEAVFREQFDRCAELLMPLIGNDLREVLYPRRCERAKSDGPAAAPTPGARLDLRAMLRRDTPVEDEPTRKLNQTYITQPAVFAVEYALARLWMRWGLRPEAMIGYSLGEYTAACIAGVLTLEDALTLVARRAQLIQELPAGAMLAIPLSEAAVQPYLDAHLSLAAVNGPELCVAAGPVEAVAKLEQQLLGEGVASRRLQTSHAFHSKMMEPIAEKFAALVGSVKLNPPRIPYLSNVTGTWVTAAEATMPDYWVRHMVGPVRFSDGVNNLWQEPGRVLLEIGPGQTLGSLALQSSFDAGSSARTVLPSVRYAYDQQTDSEFLTTALGKLWLAGVEINWADFYAGEKRRRIPLPSYPFERKRYWIDGTGQVGATAAPRRDVAGMKPDIADWFYLPSWKRSLLPRPFDATYTNAVGQCWLVLTGADGPGDALVEKLRRAGAEVVEVLAGDRFDKIDDGLYTIHPERPDDYQALLEDIQASGKIPSNIVHLWSLTSPHQSRAEAFAPAQARGFYSLLYMAQALRSGVTGTTCRITVVSNNLLRVGGGDLLSPEKATLMGPCMVVPQEFLNVSCRCVDMVMPPKAEVRQREKVVDHLLAEVCMDSDEMFVAYRESQRWVRSFEPVRLEDEVEPIRPFRDGGVYLITGGFGGVGLLLAEYLARTVRARLALLGRSHFPRSEEWGQWLGAHGEADPTSRKIRKLQRLEELGAQVLLLSADVTDEGQMRAAIEETCKRFGAIDGVLHAAGVASGKAFEALSREDCEEQFQPKAHGLYVLEKVLRESEPDFCLLFSSNASVLGGLGFAAYSAANHFMDAFAAQANGDSRTHWISANWDGWMLPEQKGQNMSVQMSVARYVMEPEESVEAFARVVTQSSVDQLVVSKGELGTRLDTWIKRESLVREDRGQSETTLYPRPNLSNAYVAPRDELEQGICDFLQQLLGIEQVGIYDNFFELGGHSLLAVQLFGRLREKFEIDLPVNKIFETPTAAGIAEIMGQLRDEMARTLAELEELSDEEARLLFDGKTELNQ